MPIYEYEPDSGNCAQCGGRFEVFQKVNESPLAVCPECGVACHRVFSAFAVTDSVKDTLSNKNLEKHGFTKFERKGKGYYERTAGKGGPEKIVAE